MKEDAPQQGCPRLHLLEEVGAPQRLSGSFSHVTDTEKAVVTPVSPVLFAVRI